MHRDHGDRKDATGPTREQHETERHFQDHAGEAQDAEHDVGRGREVQGYVPVELSRPEGLRVQDVSHVAATPPGEAPVAQLGQTGLDIGQRDRDPAHVPRPAVDRGGTVRVGDGPAAMHRAQAVDRPAVSAWRERENHHQREGHPALVPVVAVIAEDAAEQEVAHRAERDHDPAVPSEDPQKQDHFGEPLKDPQARLAGDEPLEPDRQGVDPSHESLRGPCLRRQEGDTGQVLDHGDEEHHRAGEYSKRAESARGRRPHECPEEGRAAGDREQDHADQAEAQRGNGDARHRQVPYVHIVLDGDGRLSANHPIEEGQALPAIGALDEGRDHQLREGDPERQPRSQGDEGEGQRVPSGRPAAYVHRPPGGSVVMFFGWRAGRLPGYRARYEPSQR